MTGDKGDRAEIERYEDAGWITRWMSEIMMVVDDDVVISERVIGSEKLLLYLSCFSRYKWLFMMITFSEIDRWFNESRIIHSLRYDGHER